MAQQEVTGADPERIAEMRESFFDSPKGELYEFEDWYCLFQIRFQPEDYDGPPRRCMQTASCMETNCCRFHKDHYHPENLERPGDANLKHSAYASHETILRNMNESQQALYDSILEWAETYHIDKDTHPAEWDDLKILAAERVRWEKTYDWLNDNGETREVPDFDNEGNIVGHHEEASGLSEEHRRITQLVQSLKDDLALTRKQRMAADDLDEAGDKIDALADTMTAMVGSREKDYDPDDYEFDPAAEDGDEDEDT